MTRVLITNYTSGNHDPETWAKATAEMIADASALNGDRLIAGQELQEKLADVLQRYHAIVQDTERQALLANPHHVDDPLDLPLDALSVVDDIVRMTQGTAWEAHFQRTDVRECVRDLLINHFLSSVHAERVVHADKLNTYRGAV